MLACSDGTPDEPRTRVFPFISIFITLPELTFRLRLVFGHARQAHSPRARTAPCAAGQSRLSILTGGMEVAESAERPEVGALKRCAAVLAWNEAKKKSWALQNQRLEKDVALSGIEPETCRSAARNEASVCRSPN